MSIRLLPQTLINQIAAGEVVERPSAALKELIENAIDAGSTRIEIKIQDGGKTYFSITDNGKGMTPAELELAVERHATSKLPTDDLFQINFLGFRGEALPSIASVAKMDITSRTKEADEGWQIQVHGGQKRKPFPAPHPQGTTVEVRDLFYATPARLKFLKTAQSEYLSIKEIVNRTAMAYPHIHFILSDERRIVLNYAPQQTLFQRVAQVIGKSFDDNAVPVEGEYENIHLNGFVGLPTYTRSTSTEQYLFVNGRYIKDKMLLGAIRGAYQGLIGHDTYPVLALFLSVPPTEVDVNVHPAKIEVRFKDAARIRGFMIASIRNALAENGFKTASTIGIGALEKSVSSIIPNRVHVPSAFKNLPESNRLNHSDIIHSYTQSSNRIDNEMLKENTYSTGLSNIYLGGDLCEPMAEQKKLPHIGYSVKEDLPKQSHNIKSENIFTEPAKFDNNEETTDFPPLGFAKAQLHKTYIISQTQDSIIITDQHAAHERLTYEHLSQSMQSLGQTQLLLIPEIIDLKPEEVDILNMRSAELKEMGFVIDAFGDDCVAVREIPALLNKTNIVKLVQDLADTIREFDDTVLLKDKIKDICARIACHGSIRAGRTLTPDEMNALLRQMENCGTSGQCIHGRPTYIELKLTDIEKLFGRAK